MKRNMYLIFGLLIIMVVLISGCAQQENIKTKENRINEPKVDIKKPISETIEPAPTNNSYFNTSTVPQLGDLCTGNEECNEYCYAFPLECEKYCLNNPENPTCQERFSFVYKGERPIKERSERPEELRKECTGAGPVNFTSPPRRLEDIGLIEPIGLMIGNHVTPIDHGYYYPPGWEREDNPTVFKDVLAPANGTITEIGTVGGRSGDYRFVIRHTCTFYTIYIHVKELAPKIKQKIGDGDYKSDLNIPVTAGEVIGRANAFDFSVHDDDVVLKGFITPELYKGEPWKIHTVDIFAYFVEPIKSQLLAKNVRQKEPRGGKIDYDIDGRLVGNWFVENSGGYAGLNRGIDSYKTHLAFAYDGLDPSLVVVSIGDFNGEPKQFAVKGNGPDPASVSKISGIIKYELLPIDYFIDTGEPWDRLSFAKISKAVGIDQLQGVVLVQMSEDRKIKFESFPGKTADEVTGFTNNARIYER